MSSSASRSGVAVDAPQNSPPTAGESSTSRPAALAGAWRSAWRSACPRSGARRRVNQAVRLASPSRRTCTSPRSYPRPPPRAPRDALRGVLVPGEPTGRWREERLCRPTPFVCRDRGAANRVFFATVSLGGPHHGLHLPSRSCGAKPSAGNTARSSLELCEHVAARPPSSVPDPSVTATMGSSSASSSSVAAAGCRERAPALHRRLCSLDAQRLFRLPCVVCSKVATRTSRRAWRCKPKISRNESLSSDVCVAANWSNDILESAAPAAAAASCAGSTPP